MCTLSPPQGDPQGATCYQLTAYVSQQHDLALRFLDERGNGDDDGREPARSSARLRITLRHHYALKKSPT